MKNNRTLFLIALVAAVIISASSMALAATSPLDGLGITLPTDGSGITLPTDGSSNAVPTGSTGGMDFSEPTAAFTATQTSWASPYNMTFADKSTGTCFVYNWDFGDGSTSNDQNPVHSYAAAGKYNVTLQALGFGENTITKVVTVAASKPVTVKAPAAAFTTSISGRTVTFTDKSTNSPTSYLWDFGDKSSTSTSKNPKHTYSKAGKYTVSLTAKNSGGSNKKTGTVTVK
jgi:PKD repeat protein